MTLSTKQKLALSLEKLVENRPLEKITINDVTQNCNLNRQTFYYHFHDIYDLVEWIFETEGTKVIDVEQSYKTWNDGLILLCKKMKNKKYFIRACYNSEYCHKQLMTYLYKHTLELVNGIIEKVGYDVIIDETDKKFVANFYKNAFAGLFLDWIKDGMKEEPEKFVEKISIIITGSIRENLLKFSKKQ